MMNWCESSAREKTVKRVAKKIRKSQADKSDVRFWTEKTPAQRLDALQLLRERHAALFLKGAPERAIRKRFRRIRKTA